MKTIKLSDKNFKLFELFTDEWLEKREQLIYNCNDNDCIEALTDHVMFDIRKAIKREK
jgi:hypothetical protein